MEELHWIPLMYYRGFHLTFLLLSDIFGYMLVYLYK